MRLGLVESPPEPSFTTAFLMTYHPSKCSANCAFCPQARESSASSNRLSRISWPEYTIQEVLKAWSLLPDFRRVCIQTVCYDGVIDDIIEIVKRVIGVSTAPISTAIHPVSSEDMKKLKESGVTDIGIAMDACTRELFAKTKGEDTGSPYQWNTHLESLKEALQVFGAGHVTTHLIVGLGETEKEACDFIFDMAEVDIKVGLFAFTAVHGTALMEKPPPNLESYRRIQIVRYLVDTGLIRREQVTSGVNGKISVSLDSAELEKYLERGNAFRVSGCSGCNRPYYNERPSGPMYNYHRPLSKDEVSQALRDAGVV